MSVFRYNSMEHPVPFHKAQELGKPTKKLAGGPAPDLEDVFDVRLQSHSSPVLPLTKFL